MCFCLTFSVVSRCSFENISRTWLPEVRKHCPGVPILVVGTKTDLRTDPAMLEKLAERKQQPIGYAEAELFCKEQGVAYIESSALQGNTHPVFLRALQLAVDFVVQRVNEADAKRGFFGRLFGLKSKPNSITGRRVEGQEGLVARDLADLSAVRKALHDEISQQSA